jgi:DNA segregation ATPase FtsK/SpoIIIE, S-DNA-T family
VSYDFERRFVSLVLSRSNDTEGFVAGVAAAVTDRCGTKAVVLDPAAAIAQQSEHGFEVLCGNVEVNAAVAGLFDEMVSRHNAAADARTAGEPASPCDHIFCLVPTLTRLLEELTDANRDKFTAMLLKCDTSLGASFVFADTATAAETIMHQPWAKAHLTRTDGIWVGDGFTDQYTLQISKTTPEMYEEIGSDFGYVVKKGKPCLVKLLTVAEETEPGGDNE